MGPSDRRARLVLGGEEPILARLQAAVGERCRVEERGANSADLRIFGPAELTRQGPRALQRFRLRSPTVPFLAVLPPGAATALVRECFRAGAFDVLDVEELEARLPRAVESAVQHSRVRDAREDEVQRLATELGKRARELEEALGTVRSAYDQTLSALVAALDQRERETACHSQRVAAYAVQLGVALELEEGDLENLYRGSLLHDIGKIGIPDSILLKPGRLTDGEWQIMRLHTELGAGLLQKIAFLREASEIPAAHHEAWNGSGYPRGLQAEEIPLHARVFAVVDSYDAIRSRRPYKGTQTHAQAIPLLQRASGSRLDPTLVGLFESLPEATWDQLGRRAERWGTFRELLRLCQEQLEK